MAVNAQKKAKAQNNPAKLNHLQQSMGITAPKGRPGAGTKNQQLGDSLRIGSRTGKHATKIGRNHLRDSMGL